MDAPFKKFGAAIRIVMSLSMLGSVIWSLGLTTGGVTYSDQQFYDSFVAATNVAGGSCNFTQPSSVPATNIEQLIPQHDKDNEFALCLKIMDGNHEIM